MPLSWPHWPTKTPWRNVLRGAVTITVSYGKCLHKIISHAIRLQARRREFANIIARPSTCDENSKFVTQKFWICVSLIIYRIRCPQEVRSYDIRVAGDAGSPNSEIERYHNFFKCFPYIAVKFEKCTIYIYTSQITFSFDIYSLIRYVNLFFVNLMQCVKVS